MPPDELQVALQRLRSEPPWDGLPMRFWQAVCVDARPIRLPAGAGAHAALLAAGVSRGALLMLAGIVETDAHGRTRLAPPAWLPLHGVTANWKTLSLLEGLVLPEDTASQLLDHPLVARWRAATLEAALFGAAPLPVPSSPEARPEESASTAAVPANPAPSGDTLLGALTERLAPPLVAAADIDGLRRAVGDMRMACRALFAEGLGVRPLTALMSALNDLVTDRAIAMTSATHPPAGDFCWLSFGSEGRCEQTFATDQDNGIIFVPAGSLPLEEQRRAHTRFAGAVNHALDHCGYPLCKGNSMARNPDWCLTLDEWMARFRAWMASPTPESLVFANIFFDFRPIAGLAALADDLRQHLTQAAQQNTLFLRAMARSALDTAAPLNLLGHVVTPDGSRGRGLDLKRRGIRLVIDVARIRALAAGNPATGTLDRLRSGAVADQQQLPAEGEVGAFLALQQFRLQTQLSDRADPSEDPNILEPESLTVFEQRSLQNALREVRDMQQRLRHAFVL